MKDVKGLILGWGLISLVSAASTTLLCGLLWLMLASLGDAVGAEAARLATGVSVTLLVVAAITQIAAISLRLLSLTSEEQPG